MGPKQGFKRVPMPATAQGKDGLWRRVNAAHGIASLRGVSDCKTAKAQPLWNTVTQADIERMRAKYKEQFT